MNRTKYNSMPEVRIRYGAIIGANCVVASDIQPYHIAVRNLCKVIKIIFQDKRMKFF